MTLLKELSYPLARWFYKYFVPPGRIQRGRPSFNPFRVAFSFSLLIPGWRASRLLGYFVFTLSA